MRGSEAGQEADERQQQQARVQLRRAVRLRERRRAARRSRGRRPGRGSRRAARASGRPGRPTPASSTVRTARSNATQAITFECAKCRRSPRISQMPSSGLLPRLLEIPEQGLLQRPCGLLDGKPVDARLVQRVHHLAVHVELELLARGVADAHREPTLRSRTATAARTRSAAARRRRRT